MVWGILPSSHRIYWLSFLTGVYDDGGASAFVGSTCTRHAQRLELLSWYNISFSLVLTENTLSQSRIRSFWWIPQRRTYKLTSRCHCIHDSPRDVRHNCWITLAKGLIRSCSKTRTPNSSVSVNVHLLGRMTALVKGRRGGSSCDSRSRWRFRGAASISSLVRRGLER